MATLIKKGAFGELEVVRILEPWWRQLEPDATFVRTPRSGGWASSKTAGFKARGDVMVDPETCTLFPFSVEVKFRRQAMTVREKINGKPFRVRRAGAWSYELFLAGDPRSPVLRWWRQCEAAARFDGLKPLLFFRGNRMSWHVIIEAALLRGLRIGPSMVGELVVHGVDLHVLLASQLVQIAPSVLLRRVGKKPW